MTRGNDRDNTDTGELADVGKIRRGWGRVGGGLEEDDAEGPTDKIGAEGPAGEVEGEDQTDEAEEDDGIPIPEAESIT